MRFPEEYQKRTVAESRVLPNRTSAYLTDPIYTIPMFQMLPHAALTPNSTRPASYVPSLPSSVQQNFISACEPGTTNLIPLTEIAVSLPFPALSHRSPLPVPTCIPFLSDFSAPLGVGPVRRYAKKSARQGGPLHSITVRALCRDPNVPNLMASRNTTALIIDDR